MISEKKTTVKEYICDFLNISCGKSSTDILPETVFYADEKGRCVSNEAMNTIVPKCFRHKPWLSLLLDLMSAEGVHVNKPDHIRDLYNGNFWVLRFFNDIKIDLWDWGISKDKKLTTEALAVEEILRIHSVDCIRDRKYHVIHKGEYIKSIAIGPITYQEQCQVLMSAGRNVEEDPRGELI